jgi:putative PIN family toxin of toxin-antitoxin system
VPALPPTPYRVVLDTNILVRGFINVESASGRILKACQQRRVVPLLSRALLHEYCEILGDPDLRDRYPVLEEPDVAVALKRLNYVSDWFPSVSARFHYLRDPKDSPLIELAIVGDGTHLISMDRDLLALPAGRDEAAKRFRQRLPHLAVLTAFDFVKLIE